MKIWLGILTILACLFTFSPSVYADDEERNNHYPIILVHGLGGFDEIMGIKYWGSLYDIKKDLNKRGYETYTVAVGPVSSNWDRACELYAQIKGGRVDYGKAHATKFGHERYGKEYEGLYPQWGEVDSITGEIYKVHLIGHSMGGQTIRVLAQLLEQGSPEELTHTEETVSELFTGGHSWVSSITTISTPHDGSSLDYAINKGVPFLKEFIASMAAISIKNNPIYDLKLDQFGLYWEPDDTCESYFTRVFNSSIWEDNKDLANWDLTVEGAAELNSWVETQPDIYYFSYATSATRESLFTRHHVPIISMNPMLRLFSRHIGAYTRDMPGLVTIDEKWWENDGLVSVISQTGPKIKSNDIIKNYEGQPIIGIWNYMGCMQRFDHLDIIGMGTLWDPRPWYRQHAKLLSSL